MKQKRLSMKFLLQIASKFDFREIAPAKDVVLKYLSLVEEELRSKNEEPPHTS